MTEADKIAVKQTLATKGWEVIKELLAEKVNVYQKIRVADKDFQTIAVEAIANEKIALIIQALIIQLASIESDTKATPISYK